ncbi:GTP-binding protein EngB required for normal cell division [Friedmanniella endophytica]|uniref:GTP-binding protein EngB required for normal cell division n=1 Tax=Microlunatus kandeliicorticis TaxID=1759536 RepID=A0A7W3IPL7_9ACTN|nr:dynamin family protein [Microlunatus kandeliicorticis]MBA8792917.1 GTP-binding protein EngB required for normal cell division [Microlunatus kandeliicorticis]
MSDDPDAPPGLAVTVAELDRLAPESVRPRLQALAARVEQPRLRVLVAGEAKRGKSTLVNRLIGVDLLPTGAIPLTAVPTTVVCPAQDVEGPEPTGPPSWLLVDHTDGRQERLPVEALPGLVTERLNPGNARGVREVRLELAAAPPGLAGVELVDTPGLGSIWQHNTAAARTALVTLDAVIVVLGADPPVTAADRDLLVGVADRAVRTFVFVNKLDRLEPAERAEVVSFTADVCRRAGLDPASLWSGSARPTGSRSAGDEGFCAFAAAFVEYLRDRGHVDAERAMARHLHRLAVELSEEVSVELAVLAADSMADRARAAELRKRIVLLSAETDGLTEECERVAIRLRRRLDAAATELTLRLVRCGRQAAADASAVSRGTSEQIESLGRAAVESAVRPGLTAWREDQVFRIESGLGALRDLVGTRVGEQLQQLRSDASTLVGVRLDAAGDRFELPESPDFRYAWEPDAGWRAPGADLVRHRTPGAARRARQRLLDGLPDLIDRQVGRSRSDLQYRLEQATRKLAGQLREQHLDRLDRLAAILATDRAGSAARQGGTDVRRAALIERRERLSTLIATLARAAS